MTTKTGEAILETLRANQHLLAELGARYNVETQGELLDDDPPVIRSPQDVAYLLGPEMRQLSQEQLRVLLIDTKGRVRGERMIYQGNVNASIIRVAEVLRPAVVAGVPSLIIVHNHPSGDPTPSPEDVMTTRQICAGGELLDIEVLDHIVIGDVDHVSMKSKGLGFGEPKERYGR